jgi:parvulin-like peptidyl-prolyl isomerase
VQPELRSLIQAGGLKEGQIFAPVKMGSEYSIFRMREKKGGEQIPLEKVKVRIEKEIASRKFHSISQDWLRRLRTVSRIVIDESNVQRMTLKQK